MISNSSHIHSSNFLQQLSVKLASKYEQIGEVCIVLPSKRSSIFLKKYLSEAYQKSIQAPKILSLNELMQELCSFKVLDSLECTFLLYNKYLEILKAENLPTEDIETFMSWAPAMLSDFNELDKYLVKSLPFFSHINDIRALETWNIKGEPLTQQQLNYLAFWKRSGTLYHSFKKELIAQKKAYSGLISRYVAENIYELGNNSKHQKVVFAGFNALTAAEYEIMTYFISQKKGEAFWEAQPYFLNNPQQEAGYFLREIQKKWSKFNIQWDEQIISYTDKKQEALVQQINIIHCSSNYGQAQVAGHILSNIDPSAQNLSTAVVLNQENLLFPVLNSLPENIQTANITMGYELKNSSMATFVSCLLDLWSKQKENNANPAFYYKNVIQLIEHPYFEALIQNLDEIQNLKQEIIKKNKVYVGLQFLLSHFENKNTITLLFNTDSQNLLFNTQKLLSILSELKIAFTSSNKSNFDKSLQLEFIYHYTLVFRKLLKIIEQQTVLHSCSLKLYKYLINQLVNREKISFYGEPLTGIQIMGMLETRALNFKHSILLSVNEGVLPGGKNSNSFIPYDVKMEFGLPTYSEQDAIFAYHFYRLILSSEKVDLIYFTGSDDFGGNQERSRFIEQIIHEFPKALPHVKIQEFQYHPSIQLLESNADIPKNATVKTLLLNKLKKGISPSALNTLIRCPLDFYYKYALNLGEMEELEENIKDSTMGTCVHNTLEILYKPHLNTTLTSRLIQQFKKEYEPILISEFEKELSSSDLNNGGNLLVLEVAKRYVNKFLNFEQKLCEQHDCSVTELEKNLEAKIVLHLQNEETEILIKGKADRISKIGEDLLLMDYKTGKVEQSNLNFKSFEELAENSDKSKALQLLTYSWMYYQNNPSVTNIKPCIYSFKNSKAGLLYLNYGGEIISKEQVLEIFPQTLSSVLNQLLNPSESIIHNPKSKYCEYCE